jgi:TRAP-type C4-dicarboxylate transport system permease small subunit
MNSDDIDELTSHGHPGATVGWVERISLWLASLSILAMLALIMLELIARNVFRTSFDFTLEFSGYLLVASFFFSLGACHATGAFHRVDILRARLSNLARSRLDVVFDIVALLACFVLLWYLVRFELLTLEHNQISNTSFRTPLAIPRAVMPIGMTAFCYAMLVGIGRQLLARSKKSPDGREN